MEPGQVLLKPLSVPELGWCKKKNCHRTQYYAHLGKIEGLVSLVLGNTKHFKSYVPWKKVTAYEI